MVFDDVLGFAKELTTRVLSPGSIAIDATVGNGHDTLFLARTVGSEGQVFGFDVQPQAIDRTRARLAEAEVLDRVTLIQSGHEQMDRHLPSAAQKRVGAVMFNLGYLPGSDKSTITTPDTTLPALNHALRCLKPGGIITVVQYVGHPGGKEEAQAVDTWAETLDPQQGQVLSYRFVNQRNDPPRLLAIERKVVS